MQPDSGRWQSNGAGFGDALNPCLKALSATENCIASSLTQSSITFVSKGALALNLKEKFALKKRISAVQNIRQVRKADMVHNDLAPAMDIDPQSYAVKANGELLTCEAATVLPMAQRYFLF